MAVRLLDLRTRRTLLPRNIIILRAEIVNYPIKQFYTVSCVQMLSSVPYYKIHAIETKFHTRLEQEEKLRVYIF
jgi:hypothetical protein